MVIDTEPPSTTAEPEETAYRQVFSLARELLFVVVGALIVCALLRFFVGQMFVIPSASMEGTLMVGDKVVAEKITDVRRGDVVVFQDPGIWLRGQPSQQRGRLGRAFEFVGVLPDVSTGHLIKRVIGMPGDKVICCDSQKRVTVNGQALDETAYLYKDASGVQVPASEVTFEVVVPAGRLFVMGDHRNESADSRCHLSDVVAGGPKGETAFVPLDLVEGPTVAVVAPFNRFSRLHIPTTFAAVPAATGPVPDQAVIKPDGVTC